MDKGVLGLWGLHDDSSAVQLFPVKATPKCEAEATASRKHSDRSKLEPTREHSGSSQSVRISQLVGWQLTSNLLLHVRVDYVELWSRPHKSAQNPDRRRPSALELTHECTADSKQAIQLCCRWLDHLASAYCIIGQLPPETCYGIVG